MSAFLFYIGRCGLYLGLFYAFYLLVMRRTTFFRLNRALLLAGSYLCLLLPLVRLRAGKAAGMAASALTMVEGDGVPIEPLTPHFPWADVLLVLYLAGAAATLAVYLVSALKMGRLIRKGPATACDGCRLVVLEEDIPSFSWGRTVVMGERDLRENPAILTHEQMHVRARHSVDLLLFLPLHLLMWWNPLVWITREELRLLHEYEADEGVIQKGIDATQYQLLLVRKAVGEQRFSLASGFKHANLKNRITMMLKPTSNRWMRLSYLALLPVLAVLMYACNPKKAKKAEETVMPVTEEVEVTPDVAPQMTSEQLKAIEKESVPFQLIETKPCFQGGDANTFSQWVNSQLSYPEKAKAEGLQGRVVAQFMIDADGYIRNVKILRGIREDLDNEVIRVLSASPRWTPGVNADGVSVSVTYTFPVVFTLR